MSTTIWTLITMAKQVETSVEEEAVVSNLDAQMDCKVPESSDPQNPQTKTLYISINTYEAGPKGKNIGHRVVDLFHYGTRNWLNKHTWWAMHHGHVVEQVVATPKEIENYVEQQKSLLVDKFNNDPAKNTEAVAVAA